MTGDHAIAHDAHPMMHDSNVDSMNNFRSGKLRRSAAQFSE